jgi:hypothetical protein
MERCLATVRQRRALDHENPTIDARPWSAAILAAVRRRLGGAASTRARPRDTRSCRLDEAMRVEGAAGTAAPPPARRPALHPRGERVVEDAAGTAAHRRRDGGAPSAMRARGRGRWRDGSAPPPGRRRSIRDASASSWALPGRSAPPPGRRRSILDASAWSRTLPGRRRSIVDAAAAFRHGGARMPVAGYSKAAISAKRPWRSLAPPAVM